MNEDKSAETLDYDFTPPEGMKTPVITDSQAAQALAAGDNKAFVQWMTQLEFEAARHPEGVAEYEVQLRIATAYFNASRTEGPEDQQKHRSEALRIITEASKGITNELTELTSDYSDAAKRPDRQERIAKLRALINAITRLRPEIMR